MLMLKHLFDEFMEGAIVLLETTLPGDWDGQQVEALATLLVDAGHAACAQRWRIDSTYHWKGEICDEQEWCLRLKTTESALQDLVSSLVAEHPYDEPQVVHWVAGASAGYADWVGDQTG